MLMIPPFSAYQKLFNREVSRFRMMDDDSRSRLLRVELELFSQLNINARRIEQFKQPRLIFEIWASRIAEAETRTLISLTKQFVQIFGIFISDTQLFTNAFMPEFGESLRALNAQSMKVEIV